MLRVKRLAALLSVLCILSSCKSAEDEMQRALNFRTDILAGSSCGFSAEVTADVGNRIYVFSADCSYDPESNDASISVTAPETIHGISATVDGETAQVTFDGISLELGSIVGGRIAPMQLPQILGDAWAYGYIESAGEAGEGYLVSYTIGYDAEEKTVYTYFDEQMMPLRAELYYEGVCVLEAEIGNYVLS